MPPRASSGTMAAKQRIIAGMERSMVDSGRGILGNLGWVTKRKVPKVYFGGTDFLGRGSEIYKRYLQRRGAKIE